MGSPGLPALGARTLSHWNTRVVSIFILFFNFIEVWLTNKIVTYLKPIVRWFDICIHGDRIPTIKLIKLINTSHHLIYFLFFFFWWKHKFYSANFILFIYFLSFQLAIIAPRINLIGYDTATAQSYSANFNDSIVYFEQQPQKLGHQA